MRPVAAPERRFVSRGGEKLDAALDELSIDVAGMRCLDAGASTGGFTDCLLARGAASVIAADVAYGELAWTLRNDPRVTVMERTNVRSLRLDLPVDLAVADLSFISLAKVADALTAATDAVLVMVKPQFELPRARVPRGGVVTDPAAWREAMVLVAEAFRARGFGLLGAAPSRVPGPKGNREFFLHLVRERADAGDSPIDAAIGDAP